MVKHCVKARGGASEKSWKNERPCDEKAVEEEEEGEDRTTDSRKDDTFCENVEAVTTNATMIACAFGTRSWVVPVRKTRQKAGQREVMCGVGVL